MDRKLTRQINALNGDQFNFQPGRIHAVPIKFAGMNAATQTGTLADLGSVVITRDGRQIWNAKISTLALMNDIRFGSNLFSSTEAGAFLATVYIPFFESDFFDRDYNNALAITGDSELNIEWVPASGIGTVFSSLTASIYSELAAYGEKYEYRGLRDDQNEDGAVAGKPYQINKDNVTALYLQDPDDVIDLVQLEQRGRSVYSPQDWDILLAGTLLTNKLEVTTFDMIELQCYTPNNLGSAVNRNTVLSLTTSGAGDIPILTTSIHVWNQGEGIGRGRR